jgi:hypothetical protein
MTKYRIKNRKDFFGFTKCCSLKKIKNAFNICMDSIKCIESEQLISKGYQFLNSIIARVEQNGGTIYKVTYYENKLYNQINIVSIN